MKAICAEDLARFDEDGYIVVEHLLQPTQDILPLVEEYTDLLAMLCELWVREGRLARTYEELPFKERFVSLLLEVGPTVFQHFDISLPLGTEVEVDTPVHLGKAVFGLLTNPRLLDAVEGLVGPEIYCSPVQHVRIKPPERDLSEASRSPLTASTPFHQDLGVLLAEADESRVLTVWVPVVDATVENGCLLVVPGSHHGELKEHCVGNFIPLNLVEVGAARPVPVRVGSVILMHRRTIHGAQSNRSNGLRWSFDLRYNPIGQPTGRPFFPGFVARSRSQPEREQHDYGVWRDTWLKARAQFAGDNVPPHARWKPGSPLCA